MSLYIAQTAFTRGELSPKIHDRPELEHYGLGLAVARNWVVLRHGGLIRRAPTEFIYELKDSSKQSRLIPFVFSSEQAYILEFGDYYMRVYKDGGIVLDGTPVEIATPFTAAEAQEIGYTQSNDVLYLSHKNHYPQRLTRTSHTSWSLDLVSFTDGPYEAKNGSGTKALPGANIVANNTTTVTFDRADGINDGAGFSAADVGRYFRYEHPGKNTDLGYTAPTTGQHVAWGQITAVTDSITITVHWLGSSGIETISGVTIVNNVATSEHWWLGAFYKSVTYPHRVAFYADRLCWARSNNRPATIWMSQTGAYEAGPPSDKDGAVAADHALTNTVSAGQVNEIQWMAEGSVLQFGTKSAVRTISTSDGEPISPDNRLQKRQSTYGSEDTMPVQVGNATLYVEIGGKALREMVYSFESDSYITPDSSILSDHLHSGGIKEMAYAQSPHSIIWACTEDGALLSLTYERDQRTVGWTRHDLNGFVESIATIPSDDHSELWLVVKRTINGVTKRYVERMLDTFDGLYDDLEDYAHLDCQARYDGASTNTLTGLNYLEGETVGVMADGIYIGDAIVDGGGLTLPVGRSAEKITIGINYSSLLATLSPPINDRQGTGLSRKKLVQSLALSMLDTVDIKVGSYELGEDHLQRLFGDGFTDDKQVKPDLYSGIEAVKIDDSWAGRGQVMALIDTPYPGLLRAIEGRYEFQP